MTTTEKIATVLISSLSGLGAWTIVGAAFDFEYPKDENRKWIYNVLCWTFHKWEKNYCKKCDLYMETYP